MREKESNIYAEIEAKRAELKNILVKNKNNLLRDEVIRVSQELDLLITKFYTIKDVSNY